MPSGYMTPKQPMNIKKYIVGGVLVTAFAVYVFFTNGNSSALIAPESPTTTGSATATMNITAAAGTPAAAAASQSNNGDDNSAGSGGNSTPVAVTTTPAPVATANTGQYKNGTYTGNVADAFYGNVQVVAIIQGGKLVDITLAQQPTNGHSGQISSQALPILKQEAIAAQSANVNTVSGATQISQAFDQSLSSALALAKN